MDWSVVGEMVGGPKNMVADVNHGNSGISLAGRCMEKILIL